MPGKTKSRELRRGWTTGACALATSSAAFIALITGKFRPQIKVMLPKGQQPKFLLSTAEKGDNWARAGAIKDAGDDPDITDGVEIISEVRLGKLNSGIIFEAGEGVGKVTLPGLPLKVGEPAINPKPREMITKAINSIAKKYGVPTDIIITISIPGGEKLAKKTMNGRLGIIGGLSILGTTGIVIPYSCASWINSIHRGVDVAQAAGLNHIIAATGSTSETAAREMLGFSEQAIIDMGDFVGGLLKYLKKKPFEKLTIAGGFGKLAKLSQGNFDLHSSRSQLNMDKLSIAVQEVGGDQVLAQSISKSNTALEALRLCQKNSVNIGNHIARQAKEVVFTVLAEDISVNVFIFDRDGLLIGTSDEL